MNSKFSLYVALLNSGIIFIYALISKLPLMPLLSAILFSVVSYTVIRERKDKRHIDSIISFLKYKKSPNERYFIDENSRNKSLALEINRLLDELQETQIKAYNTEKTRKKLLSNISHDIRTPLTSIIGYIDAIKDGLVKDEGEKDLYLEILADKSERLKNLIDDMFQLAKLDSEDLPMRFEKMDFNEVVRECLIDFIPIFNSKEMELINEISDEEIILFADYISLKRILENILKNSIAHGQKGKFIRVKTYDNGKYYRCTIADRGPGIPEENQKYIFDRLFKGSDTRDKRYESSGLGLSIAKKLMDQMKGNIGVYTSQNKETCFYIDLLKLPKREIKNNG